ncbi:MAG: HD domain-containing protein [Bacteroidales bacterium]|nr:HD domain-containing protein [Bacteroidales bacterium]
MEIIKKYYNEDSELYKILLTHSTAVAEKSLEILNMHPEWSLDKDFIYESALLHDIGIFQTDASDIQCFGKYPYICHGYLGAELVRKEGYPKHALVCERHTGSGLTKEDVKNFPVPYRDMLPESLEEKLICFADKFYSKTKLDKVKTVDKIRKNLSKYGEDSLNRFDAMVKLFLG